MVVRPYRKQVLQLDDEMDVTALWRRDSIAKSHD